MKPDSIVPDRIINLLVAEDNEGYIVADASAWEVETPTGVELAPLGWDEEDTGELDQADIQRLLSDTKPTLKAMCAVTEKEGCRPELVLELKCA